MKQDENIWELHKIELEPQCLGIMSLHTEYLPMETNFRRKCRDLVISEV